MNNVEFNLFGFRTIIQQSFLLLAGLYMIMGLSAGQAMWKPAMFVGVVFFSILLHELGHALVIRHFKLAPIRIALHGMGGDVTRSKTGTHTQSLLVSLAGPGIQMVLAAGVYVVSMGLPPNEYLHELVEQLLWVNFGWALLNLLPLPPLDGGNALSSALQTRFPSTKAWRYTHMAAIPAGLLAAFALYPLIGFFALFFAYLSFDNWQRLQLLRHTVSWR